MQLSLAAENVALRLKILHDAQIGNAHLFNFVSLVVIQKSRSLASWANSTGNPRALTALRHCFLCYPHTGSVYFSNILQAVSAEGKLVCRKRVRFDHVCSRLDESQVHRLDLGSRGQIALFECTRVKNALLIQRRAHRAVEHNGLALQRVGGDNR